MSIRFNLKRDHGDLEIYRALQAAGREPIRGRDSDQYARHVDGYGLLLEVKSAKGRLRPIQRELASLFGDRYRVVRSVAEALAACGVRV